MFACLRLSIALLLVASAGNAGETVCSPRDMAALIELNGPVPDFRLGEVTHAADGELVLGEKLGDGSFASVFQGTWTPPGSTPRPAIIKRFKRRYAVDVIEKQLELEFRAYRALGREATVLRTGDDVQLVIVDPRPGVRRNDLKDLAFRQGPNRLPELAGDSPKRAKTLDQLTDAMVDALVDLEKHGVIHGDVKPENLLAERTADGFRVEAIDFGFSRVEGQPNHFTGSNFGTPAFWGREALEGREAFTNQRHADALAEAVRQLYLGYPEGTKESTADRNSGTPKDGSQQGSRQGTAPAGTVQGGSVPPAMADGFARPDGPDYVLRPVYGQQLRRPARVVDNDPKRIPPQLALVLDGRVAGSALELKQLIALSRGPEDVFLKEYAKEWQKAFRDGDPIQRELLAYGLLSSRKYSAAVFEKMTDATVKQTLVSAARRWKDWCARPGTVAMEPTIELLGRHRGMAGELDVFLAAPTVTSFQAP